MGPAPSSGRRLQVLLTIVGALVAAIGLAAPASAAGGTISGTVTGPGGAPIAPSTVCVVVSNASGSGFPVGSTTVGTDGTYSVGVFNPGTYRVAFDSCDPQGDDAYGLQYYRGAKRPVDAETVTVPDGGARTGVDARLEAGTSISGHVYGGPGTDVPLSGACVSIAAPSSDPGGSGFVRRVSTDADGAYVARGLAAGVDYRVQFDRCASDGTPDADYLPEWFDDQEFAERSTPVTPTLGAPATRIDAHLEKRSTISGTVRDAAGAPITSKDVCVYPSPTDGGPPQFGITGATTDADGRYVLQSLPAGSWTVAFQDCGGSARNDVPQYWSGARRRADATPVVLARGQSRDDIDARLEQGVEISGTVTAGDESPGPLGQACVEAQPASVGGSDLASATSSSDGTYVIRGLPRDDVGYRVRVRDCSWFPKYAPRFFGGDHRAASAQLVTPTVSAPATGTDVRLDLGGTITGTVTDEAGKQLTSGVCVTATKVPSGAGDAFSATSSFPEASGSTYRIGGLPAGSYRLAAADCDPPYVPAEPRPNLVSAERSEPSTVTAGATTGGVDFRLRSATTIGGTVYDGPGTSAPLGRICVRAGDTSADGATVPSATTAANGTYTLRGIDPDRRYRVSFASCGSGKRYGTRYWKDAETAEAATPVTSSVATPTTGIDAHLSELRATSVITGGPAANGTTNDPVATFSFRSDVPGATFECRLDGGAFAACTSPLRTAPLTDGPHEFAVRARTDGSEGPVASRSWTVARGGSSTTSQGDVDAGVPFSSDPSGTAPVATAVTLPSGGTVTIANEPSTAPSNTGYAVFGRQFDITATSPDGSSVTGTSSAPIALTFRIDADALPAGYDLRTLSVLRNGALAPDCAAADGTATPDPCVAGRTRDPGTGDVSLTILTTHLSTWNLVTTTPTPDPDPGTGTTPGGTTTPAPGTTPTPGTDTGTAPGTGASGGAGGGSSGGSTGGASGGGGGTTNGTGGAPGGQTARPPASAPTIRLSAPRAGRLRAVLRSGLRLPVSCSRACGLRVRITLDGRTAKRLRLARKAVETVVGSAVGTGGAARRDVVVRLSATARKALAKVRSVKLVVVVEAGDGSGPTRTVRRTVTIRR